jgi:hypothetical protein
MTDLFADILNKKAADTEEPKPTPTGTYLMGVSSLPEQRVVETKDGDRAVLRFKCKIISPQADVDMERLSEAAGEGGVVAMPPINHDLWVDTPQGEFALQMFLRDTLGLDLMDGREKKSYSQLLPESVGKQLLGTVIHKMGMRDNKPTIFVNIGSVAHV